MELGNVSNGLSAQLHAECPDLFSVADASSLKGWELLQAFHTPTLPYPSLPFPTLPYPSLPPHFETTLSHTHL